MLYAVCCVIYATIILLYYSLGVCDDNDMCVLVARGGQNPADPVKLSFPQAREFRRPTTLRLREKK